MPFIGKQPEVGAYSKLDAITTSATATYNLTLGGGAYYPSSANHLLVSLNGVMQAPQDSFTVSGSTIVFDSALTSSDNIDFIMALGDVLDIGTPSDGTVTSAKLAGALTTPSNLTVGGTVETTAGPGADHFKVTGTGNATVGAVGNTANDVMIYSNSAGHNGLRFHTSGILPTDNTGTIIDADADLGISTHRFKDLYLSGGLNFSANANAAGMISETLDDYEVGTWTPTITGYGGGSTQTYSYQVGKYTKIGNLVIANFRVRLSAKGNISGNYTFIDGLPFNHSGTDAGTATLSYWWSINGNHSVVQGELGGATPGVIWMTYLSGSSNNGTSYMNTSLLTNTTGFQGTAIYQIL